MFKVPKDNRLEEIADAAPELISIFKEKGTGYNVRIAQMGAASKVRGIYKELGLKLSFSNNIDYDYLLEVVNENNIPEFAVVISKISRYRIVFGTLPIIKSIREYGDFCIGGRIIIVSSMSISKKEIKRMMASGLESCYHVNSKKAYIF